MKGLVCMAAARYGGIFADAAARSAAGFSVSADAQAALAHVLGRPTTVMYRADRTIMCRLAAHTTRPALPQATWPPWRDQPVN
jgi:hypothetical protein